MGEFRRVAGPQHGSIVVPSPVRNRVWTQYSQSDPGLTFAQPSAPVVDVCDYFLNVALRRCVEPVARMGWKRRCGTFRRKGPSLGRQLGSPRQSALS